MMNPSYVPTALSLQPGETENERRLVWYQPINCRQAFAELTTLTDYERENGFGRASRRIGGTVNTIPLNGTDVSCKVRIFDLIPGENYLYRVGSEAGVEDAVHSFRIPGNNTKRSFAVTADPMSACSGNSRGRMGRLLTRTNGSAWRIGWRRSDRICLSAWAIISASTTSAANHLNSAGLTVKRKWPLSLHRRP